MYFVPQEPPQETELEDEPPHPLDPLPDLPSLRSCNDNVEIQVSHQYFNEQNYVFSNAQCSTRPRKAGTMTLGHQIAKFLLSDFVRTLGKVGFGAGKGGG